MKLELHVWKIIGISPLLQNNAAGTMKGNVDEGIITKKRYDDKEEAEIRTYKNSDGQFVHPTSGFRSGILTAASGRKLEKKAARTVLAGSVFPAEVEAILLDEKGKPIKHYEIHKCRCVVGKSGILRCRPQYSNWSCMLAMEIDRDFIGNLDAVTNVLNIAGRIVGLGDYRPDTSKGKSGVGTFGRYKAELHS